MERVNNDVYIYIYIPLLKKKQDQRAIFIRKSGQKYRQCQDNVFAIEAASLKRERLFHGGYR